MTGLSACTGRRGKRNTLPILSNILLEAKQDGLRVVATDLELGAERSVPRRRYCRQEG
ncbi:MAG: hypothetical protein IPK92_15335 [Nitrospira sp.]|nr:hypothetical protein [Nitrospira sp.]